MLVLTVFLLTSCSLEGSRTDMLNKKDEEKTADSRIEQIIEAIKNQEKQAIKDMFSEQAQNEAKALDDEINYLLALVEGNIESWEKIGGSVGESDDYGHIKIKSRFRYNVYTDKEEYLFSILEYTKDTDNPDNVGVYSIKAINVKNEEPVFSDAGIYLPLE
jgi:hydrogenase maturation factor HypE